MQLVKGKDILLFYKKHKWDYTDQYARRSVSGFYAWYLRLSESLKRAGYRVHQNKYKLARKNPYYPIGLVGTPIAISKWSLPNPAILGPSMYDHPRINPNLMKDKRFRYYILTCQWLKDVFFPFYGNSCILWNAGIETEIWKNQKSNLKSIDILIYDKIRWHREQMIPNLLEPITRILKKRKLTYKILKYNDITHKEYQNLLSKTKSMIFLCEHETQGMAYQEALSSNIPVLAWDPGFWSDPLWQIYEGKPVRATSVPYFSKLCGERFKLISDFEKTFDYFWKNLDSYKPRDYVKKELSMEKSARTYAKYYFSLV